MGKPFFDFVKYRPKRSNFFRIVIIYHFMRKMLSDSILDLGKCPNRKTHEGESACFPVGALPDVQKRIWKHFSHKVLYIYYSKKKLECFGQFPIVFSNLARRVQGFFCKLGSWFFPQMACIYLLNSRGGPRRLDFVITTYRYPLLIGYLPSLLFYLYYVEEYGILWINI